MLISLDLKHMITQAYGIKINFIFMKLLLLVTTIGTEVKKMSDSIA